MTAALGCFLLAAVLGLLLRGDHARTLRRALADARRELSAQDGDIHLLRVQVRSLQYALGHARREARAIRAKAEKDDAEWLEIASGQMRGRIDATIKAEALAAEVERLKLDGIEAQLREIEAGR